MRRAMVRKRVGRMARQELGQLGLPNARTRDVLGTDARSEL